MIDNVIHHSFPPSPKLFIHRSGRAARAGRDGYAFSLVEPEEVPFMVDLHVFLGRRLSRGFNGDDKPTEENETINVGDAASDDENDEYVGERAKRTIRENDNQERSDDYNCLVASLLACSLSVLSSLL